MIEHLVRQSFHESVDESVSRLVATIELRQGIASLVNQLSREIATRLARPPIDALFD